MSHVPTSATRLAALATAAFAFLAALLLAVATAAPATASAITVNRDLVPARTQLIVAYDDGTSVGTANAHEPRAALSLSKLYLGYWVLRNGSESDKAQVYEMIRVSHDGIASQLDARYPQAIPQIIAEFALGDSAYNGYWGYTTTSVADVAGFVSKIRHDPVAAPLIDAMRNAAPVANDGYPQNFGTSVLPGVQGTKFGWADDRSIHATVSIGDGWVVASNTTGSAADATADAVIGVSASAPAPAGLSLPTVASGEVIDRIACLAPAGSVGSATGGLPRDVRVPAQVLDLLPAC